MEDISDGIFEALSSLQPRAAETRGFLSFDVPVVAMTAGDILPLVLYVEPHHNDVGLRMWEAGYLLTE